MPTPATVQAGNASQAGPPAGATASSPATPTARARNPVRSSVVRGRSGWRPCHAEAPAQPSAAATSGAPAAVSDQPCVAVSISGR